MSVRAILWVVGILLLALSARWPAWRRWSLFPLGWAVVVLAYAWPVLS